MQLVTEAYLAQVERWPQQGRHILGQYDAESVVVYQAYRPDIGQFASANQYFGGEFSLNRMSWIKPNFLWMMFRSGWGTKVDQEITLAVRLRRSAFDNILMNAVHSSFVPEVYGTNEDWKAALHRSAIRLQWDPDHNPNGEKQERRAIQLGLRGQVLAQYARDWIVEIQDISEFVHEQYAHVKNRRYAELQTPRETVYPVDDLVLAARLGVSTV